MISFLLFAQSCTSVLKGHFLKKNYYISAPYAKIYDSKKYAKKISYEYASYSMNKIIKTAYQMMYQIY